MFMLKLKLKEQFLVDDKGHKQAVVIGLGNYQRLIEDFADLRVIAERKNNPKLSVTHFILKLKKHGIL